MAIGAYCYRDTEEWGNILWDFLWGVHGKQ